MAETTNSSEDVLRRVRDGLLRLPDTDSYATDDTATENRSKLPTRTPGRALVNDPPRDIPIEPAREATREPIEKPAGEPIDAPAAGANGDNAHMPNKTWAASDLGALLSGAAAAAPPAPPGAPAPNRPSPVQPTPNRPPPVQPTPDPPRPRSGRGAPAHSRSARKSRLERWLLLVAIVLLAAIAAGIGMLVLRTRAEKPAAEPNRVISAPLGGRHDAQLAVVGAATTVTVRGQDLGEILYRVQTPPDADMVPRMVDDDGKLRLHLVGSGRTGPSAVRILLNTRVAWRLWFTGDSAERIIDLTDTKVTGLDVTGGATQVQLILPQPEGVVPIRLVSDAADVTVALPPRVPARIRLGQGVGVLKLDGARYPSAKPGNLFDTAGSTDSPARYDVDKAGEIGALTVEHR